MKKTNMNKMAAVAAAVMMAAIGYVAGKANTPTTIEPANIIVAHAAIEEQVEDVEPEIIEEQVEDEKEIPVLEGIFKVNNSDGTLRHYMAVFSDGYVILPYLPDMINYINEVCGRNLTYSNAFGRFQVSDESGRAVKVETHTVTE